MKFILLGILLLLMCLAPLTHVNAQEAEVLSKIQSGSYDSDWVLFKENDLAKVYSKYTDCSDPANGYYFEYVLFKIENKTNEQILVSGFWDYTYDFQPRPDESDDEVDLYYYLEPYETMEGGCNTGDNGRIKLFVRDKVNEKLTELTEFEFNDFKAVKK